MPCVESAVSSEVGTNVFGAAGSGLRGNLAAEPSASENANDIFLDQRERDVAL